MKDDTQGACRYCGELTKECEAIHTPTDSYYEWAHCKCAEALGLIALCAEWHGDRRSRSDEHEHGAGDITGIVGRYSTMTIKRMIEVLSKVIEDAHTEIETRS